MDQESFARVSELMADMAKPGGEAAAFVLQAEFAGPLRAAVRRASDSRGVSLSLGEIDELVADVTIMLYDTAGSWRPDGGALPWVWAAARVANLVDRHIGVFADELNEVRCGEAEVQRLRSVGDVCGDSEPAADEVLAQLSVRRSEVGLLLVALGEVASTRDRRLWLEMLVQRSLGDRSPAVSVARLVDLSPDAVRQQYRRVHKRLRAVIDSDERFEPLASLACMNGGLAA